jgi:tRNA G26 N,N-dimethylase Trm1
MEGGKAHKGTLTNGQMVPGPAVDVKGSLKRTYSTPGQTCPEMTPSKVAQRTELAKKVDGGTILETHAGKGNLTAGVYSKVADKVVLVDKSKASLDTADTKLKGKVAHEVIPSDNVKWLESEMAPEQLRNLKLVDFDPFGSPANPMKAFFKRFPVKHRMLVAVTDGSKTYIGYKKGSAARKWLRHQYGINLNAQGTREDQIRVLDSFMQVLGQHHAFSVKPVNAGFGKQTAVYAGYALTPR